MNRVYRAAKSPFAKGQLRSKVWAAILPPDAAQDDPVWAGRCKDYWERQQRLYGVLLSDFALIVNADDGVVATYVTVLDVLPGERTDDFSRVPAVAVQ